MLCHSKFLILYAISIFFIITAVGCAKSDAHTSSQADNSPEALSSPHDDGGQNLASQKAVLDACCKGVETLVTQHGYLVMQSAAAHRKLDRKMNTRQKKGNADFLNIL